MEDINIWIYIVLFLAALFAGFVDSIAGGGGLITIPALMAAGIPPHVALATNKLGAVFGSFSATMNFARKGFMVKESALIGIVFTFIGAAAGTWSVLLMDADLIKILIPIILIIIFIYTILKPKLGENDKEKRLSSKVFYIIFGFGLGFYDGFIGPGTGSFWMFSFVAMLGFNLKKASANAKLMNFVSNMVSLVVFILGGHILWILGFLMGAGQLIGAYIGSSFAIKKEVKFIRTIFLVVVGLTICKLIYDLFI